MRISDWSSDVCSSDLDTALAAYGAASGVQLVYDSRLTAGLATNGVSGTYTAQDALSLLLAGTGLTPRFSGPQMRSEERREGKSVSVRVDLGGRRNIKKKKEREHI